MTANQLEVPGWDRRPRPPGARSPYLPPSIGTRAAPCDAIGFMHHGGAIAECPCC